MPEHAVGGIPLYPTEACQHFDLLLPDYLEGRDHPEVTSHAAECVFCGALLGDLLLVRAEAGEIGSEEPPARLWANVRARLAEEGLIRPARTRRSWLDWVLRPAPAVAFAALILGAFLALRAPRLVGRLPSHTASVSVSTAVVDPHLEASVKEMELAFADRSATLDPSMKAAYQQGLAALNSEIEECRRSLARQPDDGMAREYLASAFNEKAAVLASALEAGDDR
jgi:hypothetical protein